MPSYEVRLSAEAREQLKALRAFDRKAIVGAMERFLTVNPALESKVKIKKLRQPALAQYRLRAGAFRILYNLHPDVVYVVKVLEKSQDTYQEVLYDPYRPSRP